MNTQNNVDSVPVSPSRNSYTIAAVGGRKYRDYRGAWIVGDLDTCLPEGLHFVYIADGAVTYDCLIEDKGFMEARDEAYDTGLLIMLGDMPKVTEQMFRSKLAFCTLGWTDRAISYFTEMVYEVMRSYVIEKLTSIVPVVLMMPDATAKKVWQCLTPSLVDDVLKCVLIVTSFVRRNITMYSMSTDNRLVGVDVTLKCMAYFAVHSTADDERFPAVAKCVASMGAYFRDQSAELQSGEKLTLETFDERKQKRELREKQQRALAKLEEKRQKSLVPKQVRRMRIAQARDQKYADLQGGLETALKVAGVAAIGMVANKVCKLLDRGSKAADTIGQIISVFKTAIAQLSKKFNRMIAVIVVTMLAYFLFSKLSHSAVTPVGIIASAILSVVGKKYAAIVGKFFRGSDVELQSGYDSFASAAPKLLTTLFTFSAFGKKKGDCVTEFVKRMSSLPRMAEGWDAFIGWLIEAVEFTINVVRQMFGKERITLCNSAYRPAKLWMIEVDRAHHIESTGGNVSVEHINYLLALVTRGAEFKEVYRGLPFMREIEKYYAKAVSMLAPYSGGLKAENTYRAEPVLLAVQGKPGIGKSLVATALCGAVMLESGMLSRDSTPDDILANMWQKGNSEYWNGYTCQKCLVIDELFQRKAVPGVEEDDYSNLIKMVNSWSMPLNFADLNSKGKIYFRSAFVYGTTNLECIDAEAQKVINDPSAISRRIKFGVVMRVKPQYSKDGKLDSDAFLREWDSVRANTGLDGYPWYIWEVADHDYLTGRTNMQTWRPLRTLIEEVAAALKTNNESFDRVKDLTSQFFGSYFAEAPAEMQAGREVSTTVFPDDGRAEYTRRLKQAYYCGIMDAAKSHFVDNLMKARHLYHVVSLPVETPWPEVQVKYNKCVHFAKTAFADDEHFLELLLECMKDHYDASDGVFGPTPAILYDMYADYLRVIFFGKGVMNKVFAAVNIVVFAMALKLVGSIIMSVVRAVFGAVAKALDILISPFRGEQADVQSTHVPAPRTKVRPVTAMQSDRQLSSGSSMSDIAKKVYANTYKLILGEGESAYLIGQILFIGGQLAVYPHHFEESIRARISDVSGLSLNTKVRFHSTVKNTLDYTMSAQAFLNLRSHYVPDTELIFVKFDDIRSHRDITANILTESQIVHAGAAGVRMDLMDTEDGVNFVHRVHECIRAKLDTNLHAKGRLIRRYISYSANTRPGDCGAPLTIVDHTSFSGRALCGLHVAGKPSKREGYAAILTHEMALEAFRELDIVKDKFDEDLRDRGIELQCGDDMFINTPSSFRLIGTVDKPINICPETSYMRTEFYDTWGDSGMAPATLSPVFLNGKLVYPMVNAIAPYGTEVRILEQPYLRDAVYVATFRLSELTLGHSRNIFSFDEAIIGVPECKFRSIPRGTAAGFPYIYDVSGGKKAFFGSGDEYDLTGPMALQLRERVDHIITSAARGERLATVFVDFLKDELRSHEKVRNVATRLISSSPLDYTIAWRMYFGAFSSAFMRVHTKSGMAPGICAYTDWDVLCEQLQSKGPHVFDGDFKGFDASEQPTIMRLILDYVNEWYDDGPENARIRRVLWEDLMHSRHIGGLGKCQKFIYQWSKSLPSGHPFTTILNSIYCLVCLVCAYMYNTGDRVGFWAHVSPITYGDDNVSNVSDERKSTFNQETVATYLLSEFGMQYTPGNKSSVYVPYTTLDQVTFLKRRFVLQDNVWLCPLELGSFLYTFYWVKNRKTKFETLCADIELALEELSMHDEDTWNRYAPTLVECKKSIGLATLARPAKTTYLDVVRSRADAWY